MSATVHSVNFTSVPSAMSSFEESRGQSIDYKDAPATFEEALNSSAAKLEKEAEVKEKKWSLFGKGKKPKNEKKPKVVRPKLNPPRPGPLPVGHFHDRPILRLL
ncbi:hypothetical protein BT69DRAFT_1340908 [Atractiella rhizophila]|nr:hypothetical protein BT69DRAFT_1340908 [Atractiella rhizophila]